MSNTIKPGEWVIGVTLERNDDNDNDKYAHEGEDWSIDIHPTKHCKLSQFEVSRVVVDAVEEALRKIRGIRVGTWAH